MNKKNVILVIFKELSDLLKCKYPLIKSLKIMEKSCIKGRCFSKSIKKIKSNLESGFDLVTSFSLAGFEKEIFRYKDFLGNQEKDSQLQKNLEYIVNSEKQKKEIKNCIFSMSLYPLFIIIASMILSIVLIKNKSLFMISMDFGFLGNEKNLSLEKGVLKAFGILLAYGLCFFAWIYFFLREGFSKKFLFSIYFLLNQNYSLFDCIQIIRLGEKSERKILWFGKLINQLEEGNDFFTILKNQRIFNKVQLNFLEKTSWNDNSREIFEEYFIYEKNKEKKRINDVQKYSESLMIFGIGLYLVVLLQNNILPFFTF